jgi:hypothetical protein
MEKWMYVFIWWVTYEPKLRPTMQHHPLQTRTRATKAASAEATQPGRSGNENQDKNERERSE